MSFALIEDLLFTNKDKLPQIDYLNLMNEIQKLFTIQRRSLKHKVYYSIYFEIRYIDPDHTPNFDSTDYDEEALEEYIQTEEVKHRQSFRLDLTEKVEDTFHFEAGDHFACFEMLTRRALPLERPAQLFNLISDASVQVCDNLIEKILALKEKNMFILSRTIKDRVVHIIPQE
tara:strand:+ start:43 stop:561 length:519 start_codon:yes stop_codon:yes gene_type:complete